MIEEDEKYIMLIIEEDGTPSVEAFGYTDGSCIEATKNIEKALGTAGERKIKDDACDVDAGKVTVDG